MTARGPHGGRHLLIVADDYGIGPETNRAIAELAGAGVVTATVLLVNSPYAEDALLRWRKAGQPGDLGWHPCLTMDHPVAAPGDVATLLGADGKLLPLRAFLRRLLSGRIRPEHIECELRAQHSRFRELTGQMPLIVNAHQHVNVFPPVGKILRGLLRRQPVLPFLRRIREPWKVIAQIPGAKIKRITLSLLGRLQADRQVQEGFPGASWLLGITDPPAVRDPLFWQRWLDAVPGNVVELMCHPGHLDTTLIGRDCGEHDGLLQRRVQERRLLADREFLASCRRSGFTPVSACHLLKSRTQARAYVA
jgi:predicted glycoside hydrolase/deacetylase ChbG (UPF0249 family)